MRYCRDRLVLIQTVAFSKFNGLLIPTSKSFDIHVMPRGAVSTPSLQITSTMAICTVYEACYALEPVFQEPVFT